LPLFNPFDLVAAFVLPPNFALAPLIDPQLPALGA
jgi:hypothetical protein